mmetsp:Transcript_18465/g.22617  ORF Transcript_18465/g.22617 Transcript_18465/m.22617 type:complete len:96 (-) Transcript_18465:57-344(-)
MPMPGVCERIHPGAAARDAQEEQGRRGGVGVGGAVRDDAQCVLHAGSDQADASGDYRADVRVVLSRVFEPVVSQWECASVGERCVDRCWDCDLTN